jgi:hypothetical protein
MPTLQCRDCGLSAAPDTTSCSACGGAIVEWAPAAPAPKPDDGEREQFWRAGLRNCVRCHGPVRLEHDVKGCRMDGDAYGTDRYECRRCGWSASFEYDDAASPYYFETTGWTR